MKAMSGFLSAAAFWVMTPAHASVPPEVVPELDLGRYLGTWYEVASTKPIFQRDCFCVTATYSLRDDGKVNVANSCRKGSVTAEPQVAQGVATPSSTPAKLSVTFGGPTSPSTNYWVVDLADDYSYAVVSTPSRDPIWILSRTAALPNETMEDIVSRLDAKGFPVAALSPTVQDACR